MESIFKFLPLAIAGWNAAISKLLKSRKIRSEKVLDAITYYAFAISLMGYFDVDFLKELIVSKGAI